MAQTRRPRTSTVLIFSGLVVVPCGILLLRADPLWPGLLVLVGGLWSLAVGLLLRRGFFAVSRMKVRGAVPHWPRWYCSLIGHWGYLREFQKLDDGRSEYLCESCGWRGMRKRPSKKLRSYWF